jgi:hypothetical protein
MTPAGDAAIWRRVVDMMVADRRQISGWGAAVRGTGTVTRWQSTELMERSKAAVARSRSLCVTSAELRQEALARQARQLFDGK